MQVDFDEVFISDGAKCDVGNIQELFSADAVIAVTDPVYPVYVDSNAMAGRAGEYADGKWDRLVYLPCNAENGFVPALPDKPVDVIYLCYPNNPTGTVLNREQLTKWVNYARENGALIIYDAAYRAFVSTPDIPLSIYEIDGAKECAIECNSFSKTAGFTGTRCGYTVVPHAVKGLNAKGEPVEMNALWKRRMSTKFNGVRLPRAARCGSSVHRGRTEADSGDDCLLHAQRQDYPRGSDGGGHHRVRRGGCAVYLAESSGRHGQLDVL